MNKLIYIIVGLVISLSSCKKERIVQQGSFEETLELNRRFTKRILRFVQDKNIESLRYMKLSLVQFEDFLDSTDEPSSIKKQLLKYYANDGYSVENQALDVYKDMADRELTFNEDSQYGTYNLIIENQSNNVEFKSFIRLNNGYGFIVLSRLYGDKFKFQSFSITPM